MPENRILREMLDRLYASVSSGPSLNCRPHSSRQRVDVCELSACRDTEPDAVLAGLLGESRAARVTARVSMPPPAKQEAEAGDSADTRAYRTQMSLLGRLRNVSEDARMYQQDTGVHALALGFPILSLPPGSRGRTGRVLAPIAFVPVSMEVRARRAAGVSLTCRGDGAELVVPNVALLAWLERETGSVFEDLFEDEAGEEPWREIAELVRAVGERLDLADGLPPELLQALAGGRAPALRAIPTSDRLEDHAEVLPSAVLGLFPAACHGLIRDTQEMLAAETLEGPVVPFVESGASFDAGTAEGDGTDPAAPPPGATAWCVAPADPFQALAVARARAATGLVVHGPPGTGKSQTITNIIGDHLARGERVLFVCDKRTALDVVADRLEHLGLGRLCAVVHDPQRDQRDLYLNVRQRLEELTDLRTDEQAEENLVAVDGELQRLREDLLAHESAVAGRPRGGRSFHDLVGEWLEIDAPVLAGLDRVAATPEELDQHEADLRVLLERAASVDAATSPWTDAAGIPLADYLARQAGTLRSGVEQCAAAALPVDELRPAAADAPALAPDRALREQVDLRRRTAAELERLAGAAPAHTLARVGGADPGTIERLAAVLERTAPARASLDAALDPGLRTALGAGVPTGPEAAAALGAIRGYEQVAAKWWSFLAFGAKKGAATVLARYGLPLSAMHAVRVREFLESLQHRLIAAAALAELDGEGDPGHGAPLPTDDALRAGLDGFDAAIRLRREVEGAPELAAAVAPALRDGQAVALAAALDASLPHAEALLCLETALADLGLLDPAWLGEFTAGLRLGENAAEHLIPLRDRFDDLEAVLRVRTTLAALPDGLRLAARAAVDSRAAPEEAFAALRRGVLAHAAAARLAGQETLRTFDGFRVEDALRRYREAEQRRCELVRDAVLHGWAELQRSRLLASTRTRMNSLGASLRRRLLVRGKKAMRLRQVIAVGRTTAEENGSDPLFDVCPVWMASPEAVAAVFPREPLFDVVIFDEASQCKLEEALPVLTRGRRAVVAGDPKQLPPTRFFESAIGTSDVDELETEADLFEAQQTEVEDLLGAALNLDVEEAYLDVHYRSRNADLIAFSNENFYGSRLQAIPGHPRQRALTEPIRLDHVGGTYDDRCNRREAERVAEIVADLLRRAEPPSIGIACFNLRQRDLIREVLDERGEEDEEFGRRLRAARERRGEGAFEGLFVKNLETVQGDERDHMIISTTYGPDPEGRFYRRFGPVGQAGGGRRLNVLVTRAREEVHVVTSIPREAYASLPPIPEGQAPSGAWLLFAYLQFAERLEYVYRQAREEWRERHESGDGAPRLLEQAIDPVSRLAMGVGRGLVATHGVGCEAHWGNAGFCVDVAVHGDGVPGAGTEGVLCDFNRYPAAPDPVAWEAFRTAILESQGWTIRRLWSPDFFRDPERALRSVLRAPGGGA